MSTLGATVLTLADWAKRVDPDGKTAEVVEMLSQENGLLDDMLFKEGNLPTGHQVTIRTGLPSVFWRLLNQGVASSKSTTAQVTEGVGNLEAWSTVDKDLALLNGNVNSFRMSEGMAFIEAMNQEMAQTTIYGNSSTSPEEFNGFAIRYSSLSAGNGANIIDGAGSDSSNQSSIYFVVWGERTVHGIFPKGSKAGIEHEDLGLQTVQTSTTIGAGNMRAYQERWQWKSGLCLQDWRYVVRIANIDMSNLLAKSSAADLTELMIKAYHHIHSFKSGKAAIYMNRSCFEMLDIQRRDDVQAGGQLSYQDVDGRSTPTFKGIPIRIVDALLETENAVS